MSDRSDDVMRREQEFFAPGVRRWPLVLVRGVGSHVWDADGVEYIDLMAGWGVNAIGHSHPALVEAIADQAATLMQTTNAVYSLPQLDLAERLAQVAPGEIHRLECELARALETIKEQQEALATVQQQYEDAFKLKHLGQVQGRKRKWNKP